MAFVDDLPASWTDSGFYDRFMTWLDEVGISSSTAVEFYGPRPHGLEGYWPNLKIEDRQLVMP